MTKTVEYLDKCKEKLMISSSYKLAKHWEIGENLLSNYYAGRNMPDEFMCFKIAEILELDPAYVIASIRAESEKNEKKKNYFKSFNSASRKVATSTALVAVLSFFCLIGLSVGGVKTAQAVFFKRHRFA